MDVFFQFTVDVAAARLRAWLDARGVRYAEHPVTTPMGRTCGAAFRVSVNSLHVQKLRDALVAATQERDSDLWAEGQERVALVSTFKKELAPSRFNAEHAALVLRPGRAWRAGLSAAPRPATATAQVVVPEPKPTETTNEEAPKLPDVAEELVAAPQAEAAQVLQQAAPTLEAVGADAEPDVRIEERFALIPTAAVRPLALIFAGKVTLHGERLKHGESHVADFKGDRKEVEALSGTTAHRLFRVILRAAANRRRFDIRGGVQQLAKDAGVNDCRAKATLDALCKLRVLGEPVIRYSRARDGYTYVLRVELLGTWAPWYFADGRTTEEGRKLTPIPLSFGWAGKNTAAAQLSFEMLVMNVLRAEGKVEAKDAEPEAFAMLAQERFRALCADVGLRQSTADTTMQTEAHIGWEGLPLEEGKGWAIQPQREIAKNLIGTLTRGRKKAAQKRSAKRPKRHRFGQT